ncbi:LysR family transcriptional regulator [Herbaspirillum sp. WKF16]|jgi:DNA-binding transcriptional LysR family regulator|uniref:LysR family transcriptional regulator n=1 Tax=Herbaspirillum sp. WKF16 TaxID=3028312 RepID=UPI0023AA153A|nr:LysR family transcriptional regulator [Herbaspirillum sp. WKF16]WDZ97013.1 LysR family transcriptional regulator [Herbaspirillum sp. WKF16]
MDWDNARIFLALHRAGTLRGAAETLEIDQATVGRRLAALEKSLGARLFLRTPSGYVPTPAGELAASAAGHMEQGAEQLQRQMQGIDERLCGVVRVAATDTSARHFLVPALQRLRESHPGIRVVLSTSTLITNLTKREADIAVRTLRPDSPDLIARHLNRFHTGIYASKAYVKKRGLPEPGTALKGHDVVVYQRAAAPQMADQLCGESVANANVAMELSSGLVMIDCVQAGMGLGELPTHVGDKAPGLVRIWPERSAPYDMWLVLHSDLNRTARVRAVADAIIAAYEAQ